MNESQFFVNSINGRTVECPYCKKKKFISREKFSRTPVIFVCDFEDGGCGQAFAVSAQITEITMEVYRVIK
jgi:hypothetical protein